MHFERAEIFELFDYAGGGAVDREWAFAGGDCADVVLPGEHAGHAGKWSWDAGRDGVAGSDGDGIVRSSVELSGAKKVGAVVCGDAAGGGGRSGMREFAAGDGGSDAAGELRADGYGDGGGAGASSGAD